MCVGLWYNHPMNKYQQRLSDSIFRNLRVGNVSASIMERKVQEYLERAAINRECAASVRRLGNTPEHVEGERTWLRSAQHQEGNAEATQDAINRYRSSLVTTYRCTNPRFEI